MSALALFEGLSLVQWVILSFIGANVFLSGAFVLQQSVQHITAKDGK